jgi:hypothetical protein
VATITYDEARAYFERWELIRDLEIATLRSASMDSRLRQLESLMASRSIFASQPDRQEEIELVRERWDCLRRALGA